MGDCPASQSQTDYWTVTNKYRCSEIFFNKKNSSRKKMGYLRTYEVSTTKPGDSNALKRRS
jgi:hypothetical protein